MPNRVRSAFVVLAAAALSLAVVGVAAAISSGGYTPEEQDCPKDAEANNAGDPHAHQRDAAVPGCHNLKLNVEDGDGNRYVQVGSDQIPNHSDEAPHSFGATVDANGATPGADTGSCAAGTLGLAARVDVNDPAATTVSPCDAPPTSGATNLVVGGFTVYFGADDNLDAGEHDGASGRHGTNQVQNGPSDGGAIVVSWHPAEAFAWIDLVASGDVSTIFTNPIPIAHAGMGSCADGICSSIQTRRTTVYEGGKGGSSRDVYDYSGKQWDPESCSSGDQEGEAPESCGGHSLNWWKNQEAGSVYAEPGVQVYEDPDAQASPIGPYPLPAAYVGTCGVTAGGGQLSAPTGTPGTNSAGQLSASTGC